MKKLIIFDLDGTLVKLSIDYSYIRELLREFFKTESEFSPLLLTIKKLSKTNQELMSALKIISDEELKAAQQITVNNDLIKLLKFLKSSGYILALVTLQDKKTTMKVLSNLLIADLIDSIVTRDDSIDRLKQIQLTLESLDVSPTESIVIGDRQNDVSSAMKLGCKPILINKKVSSKTEHDVLQISNLSQLMKMTL